MKKVIIASLVFLMLGAAVVYAESTSLIGRKVQSEVVVTLDGEEIGSVIIIDGVSYAPVRVIAEASGLKAGYKKGEVMLTSNDAGTITATEPINVEGLLKEKRRLEIEVTTLQNYIKDADHVISFYTDALSRVDESLVDAYEKTLNKSKADKKEFQNSLEEAERRIAEIDELLK